VVSWPLAVEAQGLVKRFGKNLAVRGIDLAVSRGEIFGLLGSNGAGKTTTLRMVCGLTVPTSGAAAVCGIDVWREPEAAKARLGYLDEEPLVYPNLTGREFLSFVADLYGLQRGQQRRQTIERLLSVFELTHRGDDMIGSYSHGMRQKIGLASLLIHEPQVLLLDEPTNGLDPRSARRVKDLLEELSSRGTTILLSTHILEVAQALCDRIAIMDHGRITAVGTMEELRARTGDAGASLEELFLHLTGGPEESELIEQLLGPPR
jgi:ABC-2 type transport system ATP-binding protein